MLRVYADATLPILVKLVWDFTFAQPKKVNVTTVAPAMQLLATANVLMILQFMVKLAKCTKTPMCLAVRMVGPSTETILQRPAIVRSPSMAGLVAL